MYARNVIILTSAWGINYGVQRKEPILNKKNPQDTLAESLEGIYLVDAGAGTGKTHTIVRRYQKILEHGIPPKNILLITFTRIAANQMREDVITNTSGEISITDFLEAPILNFHSFCTRLLKNFGTDSPSHLQIDESLSKNFSIIEDRFYESELFANFFSRFKKENSEKYKNIFLSLNDDSKTVLVIIKKLCNRGIFPLKSGWFNESDVLMKGNFSEFSLKFEELNKKAMQANKNVEKQNKMYNIFKLISKYIYMDYIFERMVSGKRGNPEVIEELFRDESQELLVEFTRHIYHSFIEFMLKRNVLNFDFVVMLAFMILYNDDKIRESNQFEYIMVDEFQDTDEIQFQLLMLLAKNMNGSANIAVVGDWKQGIYGFRNTTIENITKFSERLPAFKKLLNRKKERIKYEVSEGKVGKIIFEYNYRSSQKILNFSRKTLLCKGTDEEEVDEKTILENFSEPLKAKRDLDDLSEIKFYRTKEKNSDEEVELILKKISELTLEDKYKIREFDANGKILSERKVNYSDICILSRTKNFGLKLQKEALKKGMPVNYEGGLELFSSEQGILVLAWLRLLLNERNIKGWLPVYEKEGYKFYEMFSLLRDSGSREYGLFRNPLDEFLQSLKERKDNIIFIVEAILKRYGFDDEFGVAIINEVSKWIKSGLISIGELIHLIDNSKNETFEIQLNKTNDAVVFRTIHSVKGLEFPIVILANCNTRIFPDVKNFMNNIIFHPATGLRFRKIYGTKGKYSYVFNNWKSDTLLNMFKRDNYDEERRLLYVAATRAKQYLYMTASNPSPFFTELSDKTGYPVITDFNYEIKPIKAEEEISSQKIRMPEDINRGKRFISVHGLMKDAVKTEEDENFIEYSQPGGKDFAMTSRSEAFEYGNQIHNIAQKLANGFEINSDLDDVNRIKKIISNLKANELKSEVDFLFPKDEKIIRGTIDLLAFYDDRIEVIDYKTDRNKNYLENYKIQVEIYKDVVRSIYKDKKVIGKIFFVRLNELYEL
jgi:ATP-dependent helicase/nuclease subunit A